MRFQHSLFTLKRIFSVFMLVLVATVVNFLLPALQGTVAAQENEFAGEKVVHLLDEPRHRTVHNEGDLYLLDVQVNPGDISFAHTHDQAILLTYISSGAGPRDGEVGVNIDYATQALTHKVSNNGPGLLRILAFVNGSDGTTSNNDQPMGFNDTPQLENHWFRSYRIELAPGESTAVQKHQQAGFVAQGTEGLVHVAREDGITSELDAPGDWIWRKANVEYTVKNAGSTPVAVVINEGRR